ncbi:MAG TPA: beta-propeller fold lactonase family protein [Terriglobales bacterium]|nr:beta-propeller fold lactonase family protein [Terriglobales bacterium]
MKYAKNFSLLVFAASLLMLAACSQKSNCNGISFGAGGSGSGSGGVSSGGSVCGSGSNTGGGVRDFLFFQQSGNILNTASFNGSTLTASVGSLVPSLGSGAGSDMVVVNKSFLYLAWVPQGGTGQVLAFSINHSNGALTPLSGSPFAAGTSKADTIVADPQGRYIVVGNSANGDLSVFTVNSTTGGLTLTPNSPLTNNNMLPANLVVDGTGNYVYATEGVSGDVFGFVVDQTTFDVTAMPTSPFFFGVTKVAAEPTGQFLVAVDGSSTVDVLAIEQGTGALLTKVSFPATHAGDSILVHPSGNFVYVYSIGNPMEGFSLSNGALTALAGSPFASLAILHPQKMDQNGTAIFGYNITGGFGVRTVNPTTGALTGGVTDLSVTSSPNFAPTN